MIQIEFAMMRKQAKRRCFVMLLTLMIVSLFFASSYVFADTPSPREMIVDTDVGIDDTIAILYLLKNSHVKITAFTIESDGNSYCRPAFINIQSILDMTGRQSIPTSCGRSSPLSGRHHFPSDVLQLNATLGGITLKKPPVQLLNESAKNLMMKTLKAAAQPVDILAIGPLTTIAEVLTEHPDVKPKIHHIYIMGGTIFQPGNITAVDPSSLNQVSEWNIYIDPLAADHVFHSGVPITLVPLDVTNQVLIDEKFYQQIKAKQTQATAGIVFDIMERNKKALADHSWYFWDPMTAVIATNENIATCNVLPIYVRLTPELQSGQIMIDKKHGVPIQVCLMIDSEKFKTMLLTGLINNN